MFPLRVNRKLCSSICPPTIYIHRDDEEDDDEDDVDVGVAPSRCCQVRGRGREGRKGANGGGNGSVRRVRAADANGHDKMVSWSAGCRSNTFLWFFVRY